DKKPKFTRLPFKYPLLATFKPSQLRNRYFQLTCTPTTNTTKANWTPEEDARILEFKNPMGKTSWKKLAEEFGGKHPPLSLYYRSEDLLSFLLFHPFLKQIIPNRHRTLTLPKVSYGVFTKDEEEKIIQRFKDLFSFDLSCPTAKENTGRDLYDVLGSPEFSSKVWLGLGKELGRDPRNVDITATKIWMAAGGAGSSSGGALSDNDVEVLEEYLDTLPRGIVPKWTKLGNQLKRPSRNLSIMARARFSFWNSTADTLLMKTVDSHLAETTVEVVNTGQYTLSNKDIQADRKVSKKFLDLACLNSAALPATIPPSEPPFDSFPKEPSTLSVKHGKESSASSKPEKLNNTALQLFITAEKNLNQRITNSFLNAGITLSAKLEPDFSLYPRKTNDLKEGNNPNETTTQMDVVSTEDIECGVGGISKKRHLALDYFYKTTAESLVDWKLVKKHLDGEFKYMRFRNFDYNAKMLTGDELDSVKSVALLRTMGFSSQRIVRRWLFLKKERIWNNVLW
ncbi:UNVERIFIED_CONTAM: hypothetical protein HDU68_003779, partial [Siphonaria sp. JEL0065]